MQEPDYARRVVSENRYFKGRGAFDDLPEMTNWWSAKYLKPRVEEIFGTRGPIDFYASPIREKCPRSDLVRVISVGSGDGGIEIKIAQNILEAGHKNFRITGAELSEDLVLRAAEAAVRQHVDQFVDFQRIDLNHYSGDEEYDFVIANQVLHHIVELERVFDVIHRILKNEGLLLTRDVIGKNGHQAWPEAKEIIDDIWSTMPRRYRMHADGRERMEAPNIDFSANCFEGIRAQEILPILVARFHFKSFYADRGIVERFLARRFGHNYRVENADDQCFVRNIQRINDLAIDGGVIKPTQMVAYIGKYPGPCNYWGRRSPEFCVRQL